MMRAIRRLRPFLTVSLCTATGLLVASSPVHAQLQENVQALTGDWIRIDSSNEPNDQMRMRLDGRTATITFTPATAGGSWRIGNVLWRNLRDDGSLGVLGSDGNFYDSIIRQESTDVLHVKVDHSGAGNVQIWRRAGPDLNGEWVRIAKGQDPGDRMRIRVDVHEATIRFLPAEAPRNMRVGTRVWRDIRTSGQMEVLASDGSYQVARVSLERDGEQLRVDGGGLPGAEIWARPAGIEAALAALESAPPAAVISGVVPATAAPAIPSLVVSEIPVSIPLDAQRIYFLRDHPDVKFGSLSASGGSSDHLALEGQFVALTFVEEDLGYGPNLFYYLRQNPANKSTTFGTIDGDGVVVDRFGVGTNLISLTFAPGLSYAGGTNQFFYLKQNVEPSSPGNYFTTLGTIATSGAVNDRFGVGMNITSLTFVPDDLGHGPNLFYYVRRDSSRHTANVVNSTLGTIQTSGAVIDRFGLGWNVSALTYSARDIGYGPNLFYFTRFTSQEGVPSNSMFGTISTGQSIVDRFGVSREVRALTPAVLSATLTR